MSEEPRRVRGNLAVNAGNDLLAGRLHAMKQRMEALYSRNFDSCAEAPEEHPETATGEGSFRPPADVWETGAEWLILIDLPGVGQEDFHVEFVESKLIVRGHRRLTPVLEGTAPAPLERPNGAFSRTFVLPAHTRAEAIKAELKHGVLTVAVAKNREAPTASQPVRVRPG